MKLKPSVIGVILLVVTAAGGYGLYHLGMKNGMNMAGPAGGPPSAAKAQPGGNVDPATGSKVLYWHDPMVPGQKFDKPGKSPFMDMQLVPVYADEVSDDGSVSISPRVQQNLGIRVAEVTSESLAPKVEAVGSIAYNERDVALVQARAAGYLEKLFVRAPLDPVKKGQALAALYVPDWIAAQEEYLAAKRMRGTAPEGLVDASRQRMRLAGMTDEQIRLVAASGRTQPRVTITAPISGVVSELTAREGMTVESGAPLFKLNGVTTVWVNANVPESLAAHVRLGNMVEARTTALPGTVLKGKVSAILPQVDETTRTLNARVEIANPGNNLVPGMFATVNFTPTVRSAALTVPSESVIQTGKRSVVMVLLGEGKFKPAEVEVGIESNGRTEIVKGLEAGQQVVVSGQFLIDSESSLRATETRMGDAGPSTTEAKPVDATHRGQGKIESVGKEEITISHGPIQSVQWPAMTMGFKVPPGTSSYPVAVGDNVNFRFKQTKEGVFEIVDIVKGDHSSMAGMKEDKK
ncbi:efflux RND transporter periplasmic adaptor subunit [Telluria aromaticivorans]|uniref:Efflux RND transporter periplasmic adaptor subunit n=1 Tax=Telluria aromaticivorans TaxID=2725995 RepID=A0A7Y2JVH2_9BURK|nr:efflux RND transporter periplasmic adaptor subunit [Telluria aromaticivorans]NNG21428.1 efflux RND transporter periplasmic adaptor subunit [Telluria aromaticivorans]